MNFDDGPLGCETCMYVRTVHHLYSAAYIYFTAEMYGVVLYTDDMQCECPSAIYIIYYIYRVWAGA